MGLFGKKKEQEKPQEEPKIYDQWHSVRVNLTEKMLRVELEENTATAGYTRVKATDDRIRLVSDGIIIAEIGKRSKAYKELEPHIGTTADKIWIEAKTGEYGEYYYVSLKFKETVVITP